MRTHSFHGSGRNRQRGATLLVGLIMLILMTMVALSGFNLGQSNLQIVGNTQYRAEAMEAANAAIQEVVSNPEPMNYATKPFASISGNVKAYDIDGDGTKNLTVTVTASCLRSRPLGNDELDLTTKEKDCLAGSSGGPAAGTVGALTGDSLCGEALWNIQANASDNTVRANVTVTEGVAVRPVKKDDVAAYCP